MSKKKYEVPQSEEEAAANRAHMTTSKSAWKKAGVHEGVVLPSGAVVSVKLPNLAVLAESGEIPNELVDLAVAADEVGAENAPPDALEKLASLQRFLVAHTVVEPALEHEEVDDIVPTEDQSFLLEIAYRQRDLDALGNQIAGLDKLAKYATFRDLTDSDEVALDA